MTKILRNFAPQIKKLMARSIKDYNQQQNQQQDLNNIQVRLSVYHCHASLAVMI